VVHETCREGTTLDRVIVAAQFNEPLVSLLIHQLKYDFIEGLAESAAKLIYRVWLVELPPSVVLVPIPLHKKRQRQRGFNQSRLIAEELSRLAGLPVLDALRRIRSTTTQTALSKDDRQKNVHGVFAVQPNMNLQSKIVILVDDVTTTLSTLNEAALALRKAGCQSVWGAVVARNPFETGNSPVKSSRLVRGAL